MNTKREEDLTVTKLHPKKRGRKLVLGRKLDIAVEDLCLKTEGVWLSS